MGTPFPTRIFGAALFAALLIASPTRVAAEAGPRAPERGDGEYITLSLNEVMYVINPERSDWASLVRSGSGVYLSRGNERTYLGDIDLDTPGAGADIIVLDADFDGRPEFLLKFDSSDTNQYYYLVDEKGAPLGEKLFGDPDMELCNPTFQTATRTITAWDRSGGLATYSLYKFRNGQYFLSEETEPVYEASRLMLERRIEFPGPDKTRTTLRYYGDTTNKPVRLRTVSKTPLYALADDEAPSGKHLNQGDMVIITDAAVGEAGHMLKVHGPQSRTEGWAPEEAFLVRTVQDAFLAGKPGSLDPAPGNLSGPYIPTDTELPVRGERKSRDGQTWLEVYFLEGDASGWVREAETISVLVPLPGAP